MENFDQINKKLDTFEEKNNKIKNFSDILDNIDTLKDKKKLLWKEIYENAVNDRENARMLYNDAYLNLTGALSDHANVGSVIAKYLERMCRSNDQILKLAELIAKEEEKSNTVSPDDIFSQIEG
tara:strand:- start:246 stop:617 length:372 start_codon:yes stop_codon:yes gene_type:complete